MFSIKVKMSNGVFLIKDYQVKSQKHINKNILQNEEEISSNQNCFGTDPYVVIEHFVNQ